MRILKSFTRMPCKQIALLLVALCILAGGKPAISQDILLDRPIRAGNLTVFPSLSDTTAYYYVPDQARLAEGDNGLPEFSFLRYVTNTASGTDAEGGGIVHAVVSLSVPDQEINRADQALKRVDPAAQIVGPIVYRSGVFGLVSSFRQENGDLTRQVIGLGRAPVLDGGRAAVSLRLTKLGAQILWESFQMPTPDISFSFEMEMSGYFSPVRGLVKADWDRLYRSDEFQAGVSASYLAAEINLAFDKAVENGAITVETVGDDAQIERLVQVAYDKITSMMFEKDEGSSSQKTLSRLPSSGGQQSLMERAGTMLASAAKDAVTKNAAIKTSKKEAEATNARRAETIKKREQTEATKIETKALEDSLAVWEPALEAAKTELKRKLDIQNEWRVKTERPARQAAELDERRNSLIPELDKDPSNTKLAAQIDSLGDRAAELEAASAEALKEYEKALNDRLDTSEQVDALTKKIEEAKKRLGRSGGEEQEEPKTDTDTDTNTDTDTDATAVPVAAQPIQPEVSSPGFAALASYKFKKTRRTGSFTINLNKYSTGSLSIRFDENIGDLSDYIGNDALFRSVNLDDPLYRQRDIAISIDGLNAAHFGNFVNFVSVLLRKRHQDGSTTDRELTVRRQDFNQNGNNFNLVYGWNGDNNRDRWLNYQYKAVWSLFGNVTVEEDWKDWQASAIPLAPPYRPVTVTLEAADAETLADANVRAVRVSLFTQLEGQEKMTPVTLRTEKGELEKDVELLLDANNPEFEYEINWVIRGNGKKTSGRRRTSDNLIYVDEIPE